MSWSPDQLREVLGSDAGSLDLAGADISVPKEFFGERYRAATVPEAIQHDSLGRLVCFGRTWLTDPICVEPVTGQVVEIRPNSADVYVVNSSLRQFTDTVRATIQALPYYEDGSNDEEVRAAVTRLSGIIRDIDPPAMIRHRFWSTFVEDVEMGDFTTDRIADDDF